MGHPGGSTHTEKSTGDGQRKKEHIGRDEEKLKAVRLVLKVLVTRPTLPASVFHICNKTLPVPQGGLILK